MLPLKPTIQPICRVLNHIKNFENDSNMLLICEIDFEILEN